jgi:putative MATE family efflux protein
MSVRKSILKIAIPSMGSSVVWMLYGIVDMMWIGRLGSTAIASVTLALNFYQINFILNEIFGVASMVLLSRRWGEKNLEEYQRIGRQIVLYKFLAGSLALLVTYPISPYILNWLGSGKVPLADAVGYYRWRAIFLPFNFLLGTMMTAFRSIGDTKTLFFIESFGAISNIILDPILMFWVGLGVKGAAIASGICESATMVFGFYIAKKKWGVWLLKFERIQTDVLKKIVRVGTPSLLSAVNWNVSNMLVVKIISSMGVVETAAYGILSRTGEIAWMVGFALSGAITTLVGQSLGSRDSKKAVRVHREGLKIALIFGISTSVVVFLLSSKIAGIFTDDQMLLNYSSTLLMTASGGFLFIMILDALYGTLMGGGRTMDMLMTDLIGIWGFQIPALILVSRLFSNIAIVGITISIYYAIASGIASIFVRKGKWLETVV